MSSKRIFDVQTNIWASYLFALICTAFCRFLLSLIFNIFLCSIYIDLDFLSTSLTHLDLKNTFIIAIFSSKISAVSSVYSYMIFFLSKRRLIFCENRGFYYMKTSWPKRMALFSNLFIVHNLTIPISCWSFDARKVRH